MSTVTRNGEVTRINPRHPPEPMLLRGSSFQLSSLPQWRKTSRKTAYSNPDCSFRKGLSRRSSPIVEAGPWPENTLVSSGRVMRFVLMDRRSVVRSPPGKSVLPMDPANSASPVKTIPCSSKLMPPGVWPGVCSTLSDTSPAVMMSPCLTYRSAGGDETVGTPTRGTAAIPWQARPHQLHGAATRRPWRP